MANTTITPTAKDVDDKTKGKAAVADAKQTAGVNAGSDEAGSLEDVEDAQKGKAGEEPGSAFSSGTDADAEARHQRAIKREAEKLEALNAEREKKANDEETVAATYKARIETLERKLDALMSYIVKKDEGRAAAGDLDKLKETE